MWRQVAVEVFPGVTFREPASEAALAEAESSFGRRLPTELKQLLLECDGIVGHYGVDTVWTVEQIIEQNHYFWSDSDLTELYMPFDAFLFFGDNGGGDQFAFVQTPQRPDVFVWDHESDSRKWVANDLADYLRRSLADDGGDDWFQY